MIGPGQGLLHSQSGRPMDQLCRDNVRQAPGHLREGGYCQLLCNWVCPSGQDGTERLATWFEGTGCDAWVLHSHTEDAATYAHKRAGELADAPEQSARLFEEWMAYYEQEQVEAIGFGVITLRRSRERPNWFRCEPLPKLDGPCGAAIEQRFILSDFLRDNREDRALLACHLRPRGQAPLETRVPVVGRRLDCGRIAPIRHERVILRWRCRTRSGRFHHWL